MAARDMGVKFDGWQQGIGQVALAKRKDGKYAATIGGVVISLARQTGKTFIVGVIVLALCVLFPNLTVLWTAHRTRTSTKTFWTLVALVRRPGMTRYLAEGRSSGIRSVNGEQEIRFRNGSVIMFGARESGFGRGFDKIDIEVFDEAQILTHKALEDMIAATNQSTHPAGALLFFIGTPPRPSDPGEEFGNRRLRALSGQAHDMVFVEISADVDADPDDREQWRIANPSYPNRTPAESILRLRTQLSDEDSFRREALGIWNPAETSWVIDAVSWADIADPTSMAVDLLTLAIDVAPDRSTASVALAGLRADGLWHVELDDTRAGVEWVIPWVVERARKNRLHAVVVDEMSGLVETRGTRHYLSGTRVLVTLAGAEGRDMAIACGKFYDAVIARTVRHTGQPHLTVALSVARKRPLAGAWAWNRKDAASDITPIVAATLALWGATRKNVRHPVSGAAVAARSSGRRAVVI